VEQGNKFTKYLLIIFCILAVSLIYSILFKYPQPGVADQGDFDRVMYATGLKLTKECKADPDFIRFYNYVVTDYEIPALGNLRILPAASYTSIAYVIGAAGFLSRLSGESILKTEYLAAIYCVLYSFSLLVIIKYLNIKSKAAQVILTLLSLFVFLDGNYLVWFNSLYGEPMMVTSLLLYTASWVYYIYYKNNLKSHEGLFLRIILTFAAAFLLLGAKMQTMTALPVILLLQGKILWENRQLLGPGKIVTSVLLLFLIIRYPLEISSINKSISKDTQYNSVFYGVLKDSENPRQDLIDMGLNPDMAVEAGKHSYLENKEYVKYVPHSEITENEFYSKMSNGKLVKFYITHPLRLIKGMEYTAEHAFFTGTYLGKYKQGYSVKPIRDFHRFTLWSDYRSEHLPKNFIFIVLVYAASFFTSLFIYLKNKRNKEITDKIQLFWALLFISLLQYPMPFMGNGQADTTKQLFLFDFIFDIILVVSFCWVFYMLSRTIRIRKSS